MYKVSASRWGIDLGKVNEQASSEKTKSKCVNVSFMCLSPSDLIVFSIMSGLLAGD